VEQRKETRKRTWRRDSQQPTPQSKKAWTLREFGGKTVWEWGQLLIVPIALSLITVAFTWQQDARQQKIEDRRARVEREIEKERAGHSTLQAYLDQMGTLLLDRDLRTSPENSNVRNVARARTLTTLAALDPYRKQKVLRFLNETKLIQASSPDGKPVISLRYAELQGVKLGHIGDVGGFDLKGITAVNADLSNARMLNADVRGADLREANLSGADLTNTNLLGANLQGANLTRAALTNTDLTHADLTDADVSEEQLEAAKSLKGATMPNGQKYEEWLKDKEG
jgi:uncharacterized protein YjbI with pentapeptide repeats